jgi:DNA primase
MYSDNDLPDIVMVLEHYGAVVRRTTGQVNIKCPFHDDSHASASFNTRENIFNCFACGMQGNSLQIIAKQERVDIREAKSFAEGIVGQSSSEIRSKYSSGRRLPSKSGYNKGGGSGSTIRRSLGA